MKLDIKPLSQRDARWKDKKLGGGGSIGLYGCLLTCHAMALTYYGHDVTPDTLNELFKQKGCYDGNYLNFYKVGDVYNDYIDVEYYDCQDIPCDLTKIDKKLGEKRPVIAMVDFDANPSTKGDWHFVLIIGKENDGSYYINDPWTGETYFFHAKYGDPAKGIYGLRIYDGTPPNISNPQDKIDELQNQVQSANEALASKALEVSMLTEKLSKAERDITDLQEQLNTTRSERDQANWEAKQKEISLEKTQDDLKKAQEEITRLNEIIETSSKEFKKLSFWDKIRLLF